MDKNDAIKIAIKGITLLAINKVEDISKQYISQEDFPKIINERWLLYQEAIEILERMRNEEAKNG